MTGGTVVVLGPFGYNLGAGMTGGQAFVFDPDGLLSARLNPQLVEASKLDDPQAAELRFLLERHRELTGSPRAAAMLDDWDATLRSFWRVAPVGEVARIERANQNVIGAGALNSYPASTSCGRESYPNRLATGLRRRPLRSSS